jgi:hypothetical protein
VYIKGVDLKACVEMGQLAFVDRLSEPQLGQPTCSTAGSGGLRSLYDLVASRLANQGGSFDAEQPQPAGAALVVDSLSVRQRPSVCSIDGQTAEAGPCIPQHSILSN